MSNSRLLKEAIADAKAVKATALANAKLALEEAFTPRLQSMLTQKLRAEAEMEDDDKQVDEELASTGIGTADSSGNTPGKVPNLTATTDLAGTDTKKTSGAPGTELDAYTKTKEITEEEDYNFNGGGEENQFGNDDQFGGGDKDAEIAELKRRLAELEGETPVGDDEIPADLGDGGSEDQFGGSEDQFGGGEDQFGGGEETDDMDLEAIIRELEAQLGGDENGEGLDNEYSEEDAAVNPAIAETMADGSEAGTDKGIDPKVVVTNEYKENDDDEIDLEEILREMESDMKGDEEGEKPWEKEKELQEAYKVIRSLRGTINEVNLLNAKLLFANKLFRSHNMTNEQKVKVIETLDRTKTVREVKLVFSTLAESFKYTSMNKPAKKSIAEGIASKVTKSTKPSAKPQIINEAAILANRFQLLAGINRK